MLNGEARELSGHAQVSVDLSKFSDCTHLDMLNSSGLAVSTYEGGRSGTDGGGNKSSPPSIRQRRRYPAILALRL